VPELQPEPPQKPAPLSRLSLPTRIVLGFAVVVLVTGLSTFYALASVAALRHELGFLRQRALPLLDEMRTSVQELRGFDEALQRASPHDLEWVTRFLPNARPYDRIDRALTHTRALAEFSEPPRLARLVSQERLPLPVLDAKLAALRSDTVAAQRLANDRELQLAVQPGGLVAADLPARDGETFHLLAGGLQRAIADRRLTDASRVVVELRRMIRHVHTTIDTAQRAFEKVLTARFEEAARRERRLQLMVAIASLAALLTTVMMLLVTVASLRPLAVLTDVVRRFAAGERKVRAATDGAREIGVLASEWNHMADALTARDAELRARQEELAQSERLAALGHMAARMAHEVRNPLSSIGLNAELLGDELAAGPDLNREEARELLQAIGKEVERLRVLTEGYLDRARPDPARHQALDLRLLLTELCDFLRPELERRGVTVEQRLAAVAWAEADAGQLRQALLNLIRNAWEAMPGGGQLWLELTVEAADAETGAAEGVAIALEDSGPGVAGRVENQLFAPFVTDKPGGTGIGLSVVREIARHHRGQVALEPGHHGQGARFVLRLPAVAPPA
jgi:signal transduction histidine kinase